MTDDEYRQRILNSEAWINLQLERDKRELLCKLQRKNTTYIRNPGLVAYTLAYEDLETEAKAKMKSEAAEIERLFYLELEDE